MIAPWLAPYPVTSAPSHFGRPNASFRGLPLRQHHNMVPLAPSPLPRVNLDLRLPDGPSAFQPVVVLGGVLGYGRAVFSAIGPTIGSINRDPEAALTMQTIQRTNVSNERMLNNPRPKPKLPHPPYPMCR